MQLNTKALDKFLEKKEYVKILQVIGTSYNTSKELFYVVEAYLGLGRFDLCEKILIKGQEKLENSEEWGFWCYYYANSLYGMKNPKDALTTLHFAEDFNKTQENQILKEKISQLKDKINS